MTTNTISPSAESASPPNGRGASGGRSRPGPAIVRRARCVCGYRPLVRAVVMRDVRVRYMQAFLGVAWALLLPVLVIMAGLVMRVLMATASGSQDPVPLASLAVKSVG